MKLTYFDPKKEDWFLVSWTLSNKCNYRCNYCPEVLHSGTTGQPRWETVERFVKEFKQPGKKVCYRLSGGEPTHWKHFVDLAKLVKEQGHYFTFLTNGSQSAEYYAEISKYCDGIILSYHPQYSTVDHFVEVANSISCPVAVNLMLLLEKFDEMLLVADSLFNKTSKLAVWPKLILDKTSMDHVTNDVADYTDEQKTVIKRWPYFRTLDETNIHRGDIMLDGVKITANELIIKELNRHQGWNCWSGLHMINIDMWGNMYRADCKQGGAIGNLERYQLPTEPIRCGATKCSCLSDIYLRKETI